MPYLFIGVLCAAVFGICFLVDMLIKALRRKNHAPQACVRPPRKSAVFGILLIFFPLMVLLWWMPPEGDTLLLVGSIIVLVMGIVLLVSHFSVGICYDDDSFTYRSLGKKPMRYTYDQIRGQRSLLTKSGVNTTLFVGNDTIVLYEAMQGASTFLSKAFFRWCQAKGIDPDAVENNPRMLTWFPDPDDVKKYRKKQENSAVK